MDNTEIWKPVYGYEGLYEASSLGKVRRVEARVPVHRGGKVYSIVRSGRTMKPCKSKKTGYMAVQLSANGKVICRTVHSLICEAFHGARPVGHDCGHLDGTRDNNRADNLAWVSKAENQAHRVLHGTDNRGENARQSILNTATVLRIRQMRLEGLRFKEIAAQVGFPYDAVYDAATGRSWRHLP